MIQYLYAAQTLLKHYNSKFGVLRNNCNWKNVLFPPQSEIRYLPQIWYKAATQVMLPISEKQLSNQKLDKAMNFRSTQEKIFFSTFQKPLKTSKKKK